MKHFVPLFFLAIILVICVGALPVYAEATASTQEPTPAPTEDVVIPWETEEPEIVVTNPVDVEDLSITQGLDDQWLNILLLGGDSHAVDSYARTDGMIILSANSGTSQIKMASVLRDTWVNLHNVGWAKINAANVYGGPRLAMRTVNENFGMNIQYYVMINMTALAEVVDKLGGVDVSITKDEMRYINKYMDGYLITTLDQTRLREYGDDTHLTGNQALAYARNRYLDNDYNRTDRQRKVLSAIAKKLQSNGVAGLAEAVSSLLPYVETNLDVRMLIKLATVGMKADFSNITQQRIPADGTFKSGMQNGTWSIRPDFEKNTQILHDFIYSSN